MPRPICRNTLTRTRPPHSNGEGQSTLPASPLLGHSLAADARPRAPALDQSSRGAETVHARREESRADQQLLAGVNGEVAVVRSITDDDAPAADERACPLAGVLDDERGGSERR